MYTYRHTHIFIFAYQIKKATHATARISHDTDITLPDFNGVCTGNFNGVGSMPATQLVLYQLKNSSNSIIFIFSSIQHLNFYLYS